MNLSTKKRPFMIPMINYFFVTGLFTTTAVITEYMLDLRIDFLYWVSQVLLAGMVFLVVGILLINYYLNQIHI